MAMRHVKVDRSEKGGGGGGGGERKEVKDLWSNGCITTDLYLCSLYVGYCIICCLIAICFIYIHIYVFVMFTRFMFF